MNKNSLYLFFWIPAILLILAPIFSFPYGFYTFLRLLISISAAFIIFFNYKNAKVINEISILFILIFILYNPLIPVYLTREIWLPINFITSGIYIYSFFRIKKTLSI